MNEGLTGAEDSNWLRSIRWWRIGVPLMSLVGSGALGIASYVAYSLNSPRRRTETDGFTFSPWEVQVPSEPVAFTAMDGVQIRGWWFPQQGVRRVVVGCTGHKGVKSDLLGIGAGLWRAGNNVLLFDFRGCGESDSAPLSLAHHEIHDARAAVAYAHRRVSGARVGIIGYSMGAAVAIQVAAQDPSICCVVADSSFTGMHEVVSHAFTRLRLPPFPILGLTDALNRWRYGYRFNAVRPVDVIHNIAPRPIMLIHGGQDRIVPVDHAYRLFAAAREPKELWVLDDSPHCGAYFANRVEYVRRVSGFLATALH